MPILNRFDILSISIFGKIALSITISISIFSKITISISIAISIFLELPYRYRYRYRYFSELPYRYRYRYRYFQLLHIDIDIDIDIFQKCRYIDNQYFISIYRTPLDDDDGLNLMSSHECPLVTRLLYCSINPKCFIIELEYYFFTVVNHTYKKKAAFALRQEKNHKKSGIHHNVINLATK